MKRHQRQYSAAGGGGRQNTTSSGVSEKIRQAEKLMGEGKFALAMEQLKLAQQLQPANQYILAIMERALRDILIRFVITNKSSYNG